MLDTDKQFTLPKISRPLEYNIDLKIYPKDLTYEILLKLDIEILSNTNLIYLNSYDKEYSIVKSTYIEYEHDKINDSFFFDKVEEETKFEMSSRFVETLEIYLNKELKAGSRLRLCLYVKGNIRIFDYIGFYLSIDHSLHKEMKKYNDRSLFLSEFWNKDIYSKSSLVFALEPVEARSIFPCFDEPSFKSTFKLRVEVEKEFLNQNTKVLSNGEVKEILNKENSVEYVFSQSPIMSIYLLTLVVGTYDYVISKESNYELSLFSPLHNQQLVSFSHEIAYKSILFYEKYLGIKYDFTNKISIVPVSSFAFRALECYGCIIFKDCALLINRHQSLSERKRVCKTVSHELSHQWFGNLVTMYWWDDLWLNEGFARFMEYICIDSLRPDYKIWNTYIVDVYYIALRNDLTTKYGVKVIIENPRDLNSLFGIVTYAKGSAILRMVFNILGEDEFRKGIYLYLNKHRESNTTSSDLWKSFNFLYEQENLNLETLLNEWLWEDGYPVVYVNKVDDMSQKLIISQNHVKSYIDEKKKGKTWKIPLFIRNILKDKEKVKFLTGNQMEYDDNNEIFIVNSKLNGFYRVIYSKDIFEKLISNHRNLTDREKAGLIGDILFYYTINNQFELELYLEIINKQENFIINSYLLYRIIYDEIIYLNSRKTSSLTQSESTNTNLSLSYDILYSIVTNKVKPPFPFDSIKKRLFPKDHSIYSDVSFPEVNDEEIGEYLKLKYILQWKNQQNSYNPEEMDLLYFILNEYNANDLNKNIKFEVSRVFFDYFHLLSLSNLSNMNRVDSLLKDYIQIYMNEFSYLTPQIKNQYIYGIGNMKNISDDCLIWFISLVNSDNGKYYFQSKDFLYKNVDVIQRLSKLNLMEG